MILSVPNDMGMCLQSPLQLLTAGPHFRTRGEATMCEAGYVWFVSGFITLMFPCTILDTICIKLYK